MDKEDSNKIGSHVFLLLMWMTTLTALLAAIWLLRGAQIAHTNGATIKPAAPAVYEVPPAPFVIPRESAQKPPNKLVAPPPPF